MSPALALYERALRGEDVWCVMASARGAGAPGGGHGPVPPLLLDTARWSAGADRADLRALALAMAPVLDLGCGPGRLVEALTGQGVACLGVDVSGEAIARTRRRGGPALRRSLFQTLPHEGHWGSVLLLDGNIGIGGSVARLLERVGELLRPGGRLVVEVEAQEMDRTGELRLFHADGSCSEAVPWARVGEAALRRELAGSGLRGGPGWSGGARRFLSATRPG